jgi:hypothetical protein
MTEFDPSATSARYFCCDDAQRRWRLGSQMPTSILLRADKVSE